MKSIVYELTINERSKEELINFYSSKLTKLDNKFGVGCGAKKEREKLLKKIEEIKNFTKESLYSHLE